MYKTELIKRSALISSVHLNQIEWRHSLYHFDAMQLIARLDHDIVVGAITTALSNLYLLLAGAVMMLLLFRRV